MRLLDDLQLLFEGMWAARAGTTAQRIGRDGLFFGGGHLHPTWTPRRAHVAHHQYKPPGWLCGQDRTVTDQLRLRELLLAGAASPQASPAGTTYFKKLRNQARGNRTANQRR